MQYKPFQNISLSRLGMGNMRLPVKNGVSGDIDYEKAQEIIDYAMAKGINYFDTAYVYHSKQSETFLGHALKKYPRDSYYIATKFFIGVNPDYKAVFEEQLSNLQTDHIDFYLLHCIMDGNVDTYLNSGAIEFFEEMQRQGKIRYFGFSSHASPDTLRKMADRRKWDFAQIQMNYLDWEFATTKEEYEILTERNIPVVVMESVRGGKLATLGELDKEFKARHDWSVPSWAFRWLMGKENVQVMLSGMSTIDQIKDNVSTFEDGKTLTEEETAFLKDMAHRFKASLTVPCTGCRYCTDGCPKHISIPDVIKAYNDYKFEGELPRRKLQKLEVQPSECIGCKACMKHCPQTIEIPRYIKEVADLLK